MLNLEEKKYYKFQISCVFYAMHMKKEGNATFLNISCAFFKRDVSFFNLLYLIHLDPFL